MVFKCFIGRVYIFQLTRDQSFTIGCNIRMPIDNDKEKVGTGIFICNDDKA